MSKKIKFSRADVVLLIIGVAAVAYYNFRLKREINIDVDFGRMGQYFFIRDPETGKWAANFFVLGLIATIKVSFWAMIPASIAGVVFGIFRTSSSLFLRMVGRTYVEFVRNLPPLVLIFLFYFFAADQIMALIGVDAYVRGMSETGQAVLSFLFTEPHIFVPFLAGVFTLAFFVGAYITEIVRAGIESVHSGQRQAAYSLGLSWWDEMRFIIMPQAIKVVVPALANEYINVIKYSSIMSVVSIQELTYKGINVNLIQTELFTVWLTVAAIYLMLTSGLSLIANRLEVRMARTG
ncbi:MAG: amino acid ABC transporter permease [Anaerolineales bacterium]|nr:amino acid ABC transporter permease [Anaerolineales bacterium]